MNEREYYLCTSGETAEAIWGELHYIEPGLVQGMVYEWRGEYVREPTGDKFVELYVYELFTGRRVVANEMCLLPVELPEAFPKPSTAGVPF